MKYLKKNYQEAISISLGLGFSIGKLVDGFYWDMIGGIILSIIVYVILKLSNA